MSWLGKALDAAEQSIARPVCWLGGHEFAWSRSVHRYVCRFCGARRVRL